MRAAAQRTGSGPLRVWPWLALLGLLGAAAARADALQECAAIDDDDVRLACYDELARQRAPRISSPADLHPGAAGTAQATAEMAAGGPQPQTTAPEESDERPLTRRIIRQKVAERNTFAITPYRPNYILPISYSTRINPASEPGVDLQDVEVKFQVSLQFDIARDLLGTGTNIYGAYTQLSFWQMYNTGNSSPFRETNYQPELGLDWTTDVDLLGLKLRKLRLGLMHESNGQGGKRSRSWNRIFADAYVERGRFVGGLRAWYRIPEEASEDDNPDITDYLGYGELYGGMKYRRSTLALILRPNLRSQGWGSVQLDWSYPLSDRLKGYLQYFDGYGESLIDYNHSQRRIGLGIMLTDWL